METQNQSRWKNDTAVRTTLSQRRAAERPSAGFRAQTRLRAGTCYENYLDCQDSCYDQEDFGECIDQCESAYDGCVN